MEIGKNNIKQKRKKIKIKYLKWKNVFLIGAYEYLKIFLGNKNSIFILLKIKKN